ncbi:adenosylmethionine--8-amino-7-oxononanoate transaminase [Desulfothermobacter acidiphilus]|uniref:adenosylmethionine--8-amino-7-oxononanoate transaminase n=1 Tax=Desulfothermobacter acidiphilus TaxID=1938353 RepID=UPI003F8AFD67
MRFSPEEIRRLKEWDKTLIWHPFTQMKEYEKEDAPIIVVGEGCYLIDIEGRRYLDGVSSLWVTVHGHRVPALDQAIREQLERIAHSTLLGIGNVPSILLAAKLLEIVPKGLSHVFYSDNGSTGVEIALKISFQYWQNKGVKEKKHFLSFYNAYHGDTLGAVGVGGIELFHHIYGPLVVPAIKVPSAYCYRCPYGHEDSGSCSRDCFRAVEEVVKENHRELAAVIIEPAIQAAAGMIPWPPGFLRHLREICNRYSLLLIADEVATGFGRTGKMFACEHEGVVPDLMVLAKGITGGYLPLAATLVTEEIYQAFYADYAENKTFYHGHTYTGNPLACAVALANLRLFEENRVLERLAPKIELLASLLAEIREEEHVGDVRQVGFMVGIELVKDKKTKEPYPWAQRMGHRVILKAREKGVIIRPLGNVVVLMPPLAITEEELVRLCRVVKESIREVTSRCE